MIPFGFPFGSFMEDGRQKGGPVGSKKIWFFVLQPEGDPGPARTSPQRLRGSFLNNLLIISALNFTSSDQQKHSFGNHSLIIFAFNFRFVFDRLSIIFTISDQRKHYFGDCFFDNVGIHSKVTKKELLGVSLSSGGWSLWQLGLLLATLWNLMEISSTNCSSTTGVVFGKIVKSDGNIIKHGSQINENSMEIQSSLNDQWQFKKSLRNYWEIIKPSLNDYQNACRFILLFSSWVGAYSDFYFCALTHFCFLLILAFIVFFAYNYYLTIFMVL